MYIISHSKIRDTATDQGIKLINICEKAPSVLEPIIEDLDVFIGGIDHTTFIRPPVIGMKTLLKSSEKLNVNVVGFKVGLKGPSQSSQVILTGYNGDLFDLMSLTIFKKQVRFFF